MEKVKAFLKKKGVDISLKTYGIDALSYMAYGLFSSLLVGMILKVIGEQLHIPFLNEVLYPMAYSMTGGAIGAAVAYGLKAPYLVIFASVVTGSIGNQLGGPAGAFIAALLGTEFGKLVSKETKVDIIVTPAVTLIIGSVTGYFVGPLINKLMTGLGDIIMWATEIQPIPMGILISVIMGVVLTLPISSAALAIMLDLSGVAAGAATVGCCCQMIGFAVMSFKENGWGGLVAQGLGTSMLQIGNIVKNPRIWIPPTLASAVLGPFVTKWFLMESVPAGAGMGTCGLVGQFGVIEAMGLSFSVILKIAVFNFILPAILTLVFAAFFRKIGWIKEGDLKLDL